MPDTVQTGPSAVIDFLSGFGKGMVQADINKREKEKHDLQKQRWQQEMTAFAAQDELRKMQMENSRLEIDMRKTQFDDIQATREQTKGFVAFMVDTIGKAKGKPAEKQSSLLEAYTTGAEQFPMADMDFGDKLIDMYSKIQTTIAPKAWKIKDVKDYDTGKKRQAIVGEYGEFMGYMPGDAENLEIVNETIANGIEIHQKEFDDALQALLAGKSIVLGSEGQSLDLESFMASVEKDDDRTKSERTADWIFEVHNRIWDDIHKKSGTLDVRLGRMLTGVVKNNDIRDALVKPYGKQDHTAGVKEKLEEYSLEERTGIIAEMAEDFELLLPEYEMPLVRMELARLQNKTSLALRAKEGVERGGIEAKQASMAKQTVEDKKRKEEELVTKYMQERGTTTPARVIKGAGRSLLGARKSARDWWDNFLAEQPKSFWPDREAEAIEAVKKKQESDAIMESAVERLNTMREK